MYTHIQVSFRYPSQEVERSLQGWCNAAVHRLPAPRKQSSTFRVKLERRCEHVFDPDEYLLLACHAVLNRSASTEDEQTRAVLTTRLRRHEVLEGSLCLWVLYRLVDLSSLLLVWRQTFRTQVAPRMVVATGKTWSDRASASQRRMRGPYTRRARAGMSCMAPLRWGCAVCRSKAPSGAWCHQLHLPVQSSSLNHSLCEVHTLPFATNYDALRAISYASRRLH